MRDLSDKKFRGFLIQRQDFEVCGISSGILAAFGSSLHFNAVF